jgi:hypothetical protein
LYSFFSLVTLEQDSVFESERCYREIILARPPELPLSHESQPLGVNMLLQCYMCEAHATSREHVPPRSLFPENRDLGENHRKELMTVPSCDLHNSAKSREDEFLMVSLAGIIGNNSLGYRHKLTKVDRAIRRSAGRLLDSVFKRKTLHKVQLKDNKFIDVIWGTPDIERLNKCFEHIAYGLHHFHFGKRFEGRIRIMLGYLHHETGDAKTFCEFIRDRSEIDLVGQPKVGENPAAFFFQVTDYDQFGLFMIKMCFYGGLNVYAAFVPQSTDAPTNLASVFIDSGIHTVVTLGEKTYEFNKKNNA